MTFREVQVGQRFILKTDVDGGHGPYRKLSATKVVGCWNGVVFKVKNLDSPIADCAICSAPLLTNGRLDYEQRGKRFTHKDCEPVPEGC